ncbi:Y-family DNA polymerase [bacterium]|nr:Y-family DNA polymerase [bacterium]
MYAVIDANNFYVSCERVINPKLQGIPVIVANPGGIVLARSEEAKRLGIKMAVPLFKIQEQVREYGIKVIPTRFALYSDISRRMAIILQELFPVVEEYSIDESFLYFQDETPIREIENRCREARHKIMKWVGIPVSVGISSTKTLAKVAVGLAKKELSGIMSITVDSNRKKILEDLPIGDIWGVGWSLSKKLPAYGITKAAHLASQDVLQIRKKFSVTLAYTVNELNGIPCFSVDNTPRPAKSLMCTESYREEISSEAALLEKLRALAVRAGKQLRKQKEVAGGMGIFVRGNRFHKERGYLANQEVTTFAPPTANTPSFIKFIENALPKIFPPGSRVKRAGIYMLDLILSSDRQYGLFENQPEEEIEKDDRAMKAIDAIDKKWGKKSGVFLSIKV